MQPPDIAEEQKNGTVDPRVNFAASSDLDLAGITNRGSGTKSPFDKSFLDSLSRTLAKHGPAFAKLSLIAGSMTATVYNALRAGARPEVLNGDLVFFILTAAGLIVECGFAYAWSKRGSYDLAGEQRNVAKQIFNRSSFIMIGDLSLSVAEIAFGVGNIAVIWIGIIQPVFAVHIVRLFYRLKGLHPEYLAEMRVVDLRAQMTAAQTLDLVEETALELEERRHMRELQWASLEERTHHGWKLVSSRWFKRQVKRAVKASVGYSLLEEARQRSAQLKNVLRIGQGAK